ncbi:MAG: hypothetical protein K2Y23_02180 [Cyanobacteria bacterium]|nr:hypothetical protein [Cyanobacteriota bacterium]
MSRGSRKHVLDWTSRPNFLVELLQLVSPVECKLTAATKWMPQGHERPQEARLESFDFLPHDVRARLQKWWLAHDVGANTPNWDIAVGCQIEGKAGLILVEAKANVPEMSSLGKKLGDDASERSVANHGRITEAIDEACEGLRRAGAMTSIKADRHYQLANRVAFAWKLADLGLGVPIVLIYLGFTGDEGIRDAGEPFRDHEHWESAFHAYADSTVPKNLFGSRIDCGKSGTWFLVRSRRVLEISPLR